MKAIIWIAALFLAAWLLLRYLGQRKNNNDAVQAQEQTALQRLGKIANNANVRNMLPLFDPFNYPWGFNDISPNKSADTSSPRWDYNVNTEGASPVYDNGESLYDELPA